MQLFIAYAIQVPIMTTNAITVRNVSDWYLKWTPDSKLNYEDARRAIDELEALVESYCDVDLKGR